MKPRIGNIGITSTHAIKGRKSQLIRFEKELREAGYDGVISNEAGRLQPHCKWIVLYENNSVEPIHKTYAYRSTDGRFSRRPPEIFSISKMRKILNKS